jgi:hypothetical protein
MIQHSNNASGKRKIPRCLTISFTFIALISISFTLVAFNISKVNICFTAPCNVQQSINGTPQPSSTLLYPQGMTPTSPRQMPTPTSTQPSAPPPTQPSAPPPTQPSAPPPTQSSAPPPTQPPAPVVASTYPPTSTPAPSQIHFVRSPVVARNADGRIEVFAVGSDTQLYHKWEYDSNGDWSSWVSLGGSWPGQPAIGMNTDGRLEIFIVGNQGQSGAALFHAWQTSPGSDLSWSNWTALAGDWPAGTPAVTRNLAGGLQVFMRGLDSNLYSAWESNPGNSTNYTSWVSMGGIWNTDPVVANNQDGTMEVFLVGEGTQLYYNQENAQGNWSGWQSLGGSWPGQLSVTLNNQGELELFLVGDQGPNEANLFYTWQTSPESSSWAFDSGGGWYKLPGYWPPGNPVVIDNPGSNLMDVFSPQNNGVLSHDWETSTWNGPQSLGGNFTGQPAATINLAGGIEVFMLGTDGKIYYCWESTPGNSASYTSWFAM